MWVELANVSREGEEPMKEDNSFGSGWWYLNSKILRNDSTLPQISRFIYTMNL